MSFRIDPRLAADTHPVAELVLSRLLLMDDARFPWLILVPRIVGARELIDLDLDDRRHLLDELSTIGRTLEALLRPDKLNIAALGNEVTQLHVHVIARYSKDAAWPQPVWGHGQRQPYEACARERRVSELRNALTASPG
ncbi:HIT domain-containing protein [Dokdonella sp.]|uniref:HIT domain-containing protein n=1 Tax=Dokdonella sp. TaxID=2291710 RepID=UPI0031C9BF68|nr:HIT family protein [Dokdonella sp.]